MKKKPFEVEYKQGMTTAWSDGEKLTIKNPTGKRHVKTNIEQIFGMGEFDKIREYAYIEEETRSKSNVLAIEYLIVSGYIPERVNNDYKDYMKEDLTKKYFKDKDGKEKTKT